MSKKPGKQRKKMYTAPAHKRRKMISAHLSDELMLKYNRRSLPVKKGDTVKIIRGEKKGYTNVVASVNTKKRKIVIEGYTIKKSDGKMTARPIDPSNVIITKLDLSDKWRTEHILSKRLSKE